MQENEYSPDYIKLENACQMLDELIGDEPAIRKALMIYTAAAISYVYNKAKAK